MKFSIFNFQFSINFQFLIAILIFAFLILNLSVHAQELEIDLNWHSSTLVPESYKGRALPVRGSTITVVAITTQENLIYDWYLDRNYMKYASGLNRDSFSFIATEWPGYEHNIRVKVYKEDETAIGYASTSIDIQEPEVHLSAREYVMQPGQTKTFQAVPYFFTSRNLTYKWLFNNQEVKGETRNPEIFTLTISPDSGTNATRKLDVIVRNPNNLLERAQLRAVINIK